MDQNERGIIDDLFDRLRGPRDNPRGATPRRRR